MNVYNNWRRGHSHVYLLTHSFTCSLAHLLTHSHTIYFTCFRTLIWLSAIEHTAAHRRFSAVMPLNSNSILAIDVYAVYLFAIDNQMMLAPRRNNHSLLLWLPARDKHNLTCLYCAYWFLILYFVICEFNNNFLCVRACLYVLGCGFVLIVFITSSAFVMFSVRLYSLTLQAYKLPFA